MYTGRERERERESALSHQFFSCFPKGNKKKKKKNFQVNSLIIIFLVSVKSLRAVWGEREREEQWKTFRGPVSALVEASNVDEHKQSQSRRTKKEPLVESCSVLATKMKFESKKRWKSFAPVHLKSKPVTRFCFFSKVKSANFGPGRAPVYLNVYDLTPINGYIYWAGLGIFHSGVEVHGIEYAYGSHDYPTSGVFEVEPRQCPGFKFKKSILIGTSSLSPVQVREFMEDLACSYYGNTYHLLVKNCNHFCQDACYKLTGKRIPKWVNRLAELGSVFSCVLPEALEMTAVCHDPEGQHPEVDNEKRSLRSSSNCLSSISMRQRQLSTSSLFLQSPLRGCLPPWQLKLSKSNCSFWKKQ